MNILAIDTSGRHISLAVYTERGLVLEYNEWVDNTISDRLPGLLMTHVLPIVDDLAKIDALGACVGPGPFTGIRIGLTVCKALIIRYGLAFRPVNSLKALAYSILGPIRHVAAIMDARRGEYYAAVYGKESDGIMVEIAPPSLVAESGLSQWISQHCSPTVVVGLMSDKTEDSLRLAGLVTVRKDPYLAREIVCLTRDEESLWLRESQELRPLYLREPDAVMARS